MLRKLYCDIISLDKILPEICCTNQELLNFCSNILVTKDNKKSELQIPTTICENYDIETSLHYIIEVEVFISFIRFINGRSNRIFSKSNACEISSFTRF